MKFLVASLGTFCALVLGPQVVQAQAPDGAAIYKQSCAACHGSTGVPAAGMVKMFKGLKPLTDPEFFAKRSQDSIVAALENGVGDMKPLKAKLSKEQMIAAAKYIRTLAPAKEP